MIRAVFFDFYGTLAGWQPPGALIQQRAAAQEGIELSQDDINHAYPAANAFMDRENARQRIAARPLAERDRFFAEYEARLLKAAGHPVTSEVAARIWDRVRETPKEFGAYPDAAPALRAATRAGLAVGVISNMGPELGRLLVDLGLGSHVQVSVSSEEAGVAKPDPRIFQAALDRVAVAAHETLHVGDGYESDVMGARNAGIHPLLLLREAGQAVPFDCPTVQSLMEVQPYIEANPDFR